MAPTSQDATKDSTDAPPETGPPEIGPLPAPEQISELRKEIDWLDSQILQLVKRRTEVSKLIGAARMAAGGTRLVINREHDVISRYSDLGQEGRQLAMALLSLGRGPLGRQISG